MDDARGGGTRGALSGQTVGRFRFGECLGTGATGEVYSAFDTQLHRTVAIKRLAPGTATDHSPRHGLLREAQRASSLNHPHIASVYDVVSIGDELLLVMEFVDGATLRALMGAPVALPQFVHIAVQCAAALSEAHAHGILHGDIKPANIMLTRETDTVKLCDFGLARRLAGGLTSQDSVSTVRNGLAGTPAYMAPEVVLEQPADERADVFSLGVVFYEMLAGHNPYSGSSLVETLTRICELRPPPLDKVDQRIPAAVSRLVARMLETNREKRTLTAAEVADTLTHIARERDATGGDPWRVWRWVAAVGAAVVLVLGVAGARRAWRGPLASGTSQAVPARVHLAVLPFAVRGADDRGPIAQGLVAELTTRLSRLTVGRGLQVASMADVRSRTVSSPRDARDQLGATVALVGALDYGGDRVRVATRLVDTASGGDIRRATFEVDVSQISDLCDDIVVAAVEMLGLALKPDERHALTAKGTVQPGAYDYYLQARGYLQDYFRLESLDNAVIVFRRALEVDPRYALAYAGLGQAYWRKYELTGANAWVEPARGACEGALALDFMASEAHACLAMVLNGTGAYEGAVNEFSRALELDPTNDVVNLGLAAAYERLGRHADAERTLQRAVALRPQYWATHSNLAAYYYRRGLYDQALTSFHQSVSLAPDSFRGYSSIGAVHFAKDQLAPAVAAFEKSLSIRPNFVAASNLGTLFFYDGLFDRAVGAYEQALSFEQGNYRVWANLADALDAAGRTREGGEAHAKTLELAEDGLRVNPRDVSLQLVVAQAAAAVGNRVRAQTALEDALKASPSDAAQQFSVAVFYERWQNDRARALEWLAKAVANGQTWRQVERLPWLRALRDDPRFQELRRNQ